MQYNYGKSKGELFIKKFLIIVFSIIIAVFGGLFLSKWIANTVTDNFDKKVTSEHFEISYNLSDEKVVPDVQEYLEENYEKITTNLKQPLDETIQVKIFPDLKSLHNAIKVHGHFFWWKGDVQDWVVGSASGGPIRIVSPLNPGNPGHTYEGILKVAVHEFTHIVASKINSNVNASIFSEGIALYEAHQDINVSNDLTTILPNSIEELFSWKNDNDFGASRVYTLGGSFVGFIIENYGYGKFIELYKRDYSNNVFDEDIKQIYNNWIDTVKNA